MTDDVTVHHGDALDVLAGMPDASVDAVVTDPPYGLEFMGKDWDRFAPERTQYHGERADTRKNIGSDDTKPSRRHRVNYAMTRPTFRRCTVCGKREFSGSPCRCETPDWTYEQPSGTPTRMAAYQQWCEQWAAECLRLLRPGGHLLAFGGTRTFHRLACAIEDAGFEIRDTISYQHMKHVFCQCSPVPQPAEQRPDELGALAVEWIAQGGGAWPGCPRCHKPLAPPFEGGHLVWNYGSGFPKSLDVSKAIDRAAGAEREVVGRKGGRYEYATRPEIGVAHAPGGMHRWGDRHYTWDELPQNARDFYTDATQRKGEITAPATDDARRWQGWGTALKPAWEPVIVARKPLAGTVAGNVLAHGTEALNIDGCRVDTNGETWAGNQANAHADYSGKVYGQFGKQYAKPSNPAGRWPANVVLDEDAAAQLDRQSGTSVSRRALMGAGPESEGWGMHTREPGMRGHDDFGGASRFYYTAKADPDERPRINGVSHPTVKPLDLIRWLVRLVTPPGGLVLDPFAGSGTTGEACIIEGFRCVLIEREADYLPLIDARLSKPIQPTLGGTA